MQKTVIRKATCFLLLLSVIFLLLPAMPAVALDYDEEAETPKLLEYIGGKSNPTRPETRYEVEQFSEYIYVYHDTSASGLLNSANLYFHFNLTDDVDVVKMWDAREVDYDLTGVYTYRNVDYPAYDRDTDTLFLRAAYSGTLSSRNYAGCYYFLLSNGQTITLVFDGVSHSVNTSYPDSMSLVDATTGDELGEKYTITELTTRGNDRNDLSLHMFVVETAPITEPLLLSAQSFGGNSKWSAYDYTSIGTSVANAQPWTETYNNFVILNGVRLPDFDTSTDMVSVRSAPFTLQRGLNVIEYGIDIGGFYTSTAETHWFNQNSRIISVVYVFEYQAEAAAIPEAGSDTGLQEGGLNAYISDVSMNAAKFEKRSIISDGEGGYIFSAPESRSMKPAANQMYSCGAVLSIVPNDPLAKVEILNSETDDFVSGREIGSCHAITLCNLPTDKAFTIRVTAANGEISKDYPVKVVFADSSTAINTLDLDGGSLDETFSSDQVSYYLTFDEGKSEATVTLTLPEGATAFANDNTTAETMAFNAGNMLNTITVLAADGVSTQKYYFITRKADGTVPYFTISGETKEQASRILNGYWTNQQNATYYAGVWEIYKAMAAGIGFENGEVMPVDWNGKYVYDVRQDGNAQATFPARDILVLVMLGENPYNFDPDGDGVGINYVDLLLTHSHGEAWANNIWYNMAAKAVGIEPLFESSLKTNALDNYYDLDMRAWTIASLNGCFGLETKDIIPYIEELHHIQATYENGLGNVRYRGLFRGLAFYNGDANPYTIGCVLSAIASVGCDPDIIFEYTYNGQNLSPLNQIENVVLDPDTGAFWLSAGSSSLDFAKDMIIGLGDILYGSNVWDRCSLTSEKYASLLEKAMANGIDTADMPAFGEAGYGKAYYSLYEQVANKLEESGDTSMRPDVIWGMPHDVFKIKVDALPDESDDTFVGEVQAVIELYESFDDAIIAYIASSMNDTLTAYHAAVAAGLNKQDNTGVTADFYTRVLALPDALIITEDSREEVAALRAIHDGMNEDQRDLIDWAGTSVLLQLQAAEAALGQGSGSNTMTIHFTLLGAPDDGVNGTVHTLTRGNLETWLEGDYTFNAESLTVEQVFRVIMGLEGIPWKGDSNNNYGSLYIYAVKSPLTGDWMEAYTTGENSGWMYTVNGFHPNVGVTAYTLKNGDAFVFHYTDDYTEETDPWAGQIINDEDKTGATTVITDAVAGTFVVECQRACAVIAEADDGSYVLLPAQISNNIVSFTAGSYTKVYIRVKGDLDGDGKADDSDTLLMKQLVAGIKEPDAITALLLDVTGDGKINSSDTLKMKRIAVGLDSLAW